MSPRAPVSCFDRALKLLTQRSHFRRQLEQKLRQRGYPEDEIEAALERLEELSYLDDFRTARELVQLRLRRGAEGRRRLRAELAKRGAPEEAIDEALEALVPEDDLPLAREEAQRWAARGRGDWKSLARRLERKGFTLRSIRTVLDEAREAEPDDGPA